MEGNENVQKVKHYKDGDTRDRNGRWAGKVVTVRKEYYAAIEELRQKTGLKKAVFWRLAVLYGVKTLADNYHVEFSFPAIEEKSQPVEVKPKRKFPSWLFRKGRK